MEKQGSLFLSTKGGVFRLIGNGLSLLNLAIGACLCLGTTLLEGWVPQLLAAAAISDAMDGFFARLSGAPSRLGQLLDSIADAVTFGIFPTVYLLRFLESSQDVTDPNAFLVPVTYLVFSLSREIRSCKKSRFFIGFPNTLVGLLVVLYLYSNGSHSLIILVLPIAGMILPFPVPSLDAIQGRIGKIATPVLAIAGTAIVASSPFRFLVLLNVLVAIFIILELTKQATVTAASAWLELSAQSSSIRYVSSDDHLFPGVYTFFVKDLYCLLLFCRKVSIRRGDVLIVVGNKIGGRLIRRILIGIGFSVFMVDNNNKFSWRRALFEADHYQYIVVAADGPLGPYGTFKSGCRTLAKRARSPLYRFEFHSNPSKSIPWFRGGLQVPLPFSSIYVNVKTEVANEQSYFDSHRVLQS